MLLNFIALDNSSPNNLKPLSTIEIDTKIPFVLKPAFDIQQVGPDEQGNIFNGIFTCCVARGIIKKSTIKCTADLNENRSSESMTDLKKATSATYFPRFVMKLRAELGGINIEHSFTAKWSQLEDAFYNAIGKEQNVGRMSSFYAKDFSNFDSKPMELIIFDVDTHMDKTLGRSEKTFTDKNGRIQ